MSKRKKIFILTVFTVSVIVTIFFLSHYPDSNTSITSLANTEEEKVAIKNEEKEFVPRVSLNQAEAKLFKQLLSKVMEYNRNHPIEYASSASYRCKVIDQYGSDVPEAKYWVNYHNGKDDKQINHGGFNLKADQSGAFQFTINDKVSSATVAVSKLGYKNIEGKSLRYLIQKPSAKSDFNNADALTKEELKIFTVLLAKSGLVAQDEVSKSESVVVFVLHKMSDYDKMYQNMFTYSDVSSDTDEQIPGNYMMEYGNHGAAGVVPADAHVIQIGPCFYDKAKEKQLKIRYNISNQIVDTPAAPWYCEMNIQGGGFFLIDEKIEPDGDIYQSKYAANARAGEEFLAPEIGFKETVRVEMPESRMDETWRNSYTQNYYVKFSDNTYGRIKVLWGRGGYYQITSWYNPTGRRNTEFCLEDDLDVKYIDKKR
jgi:hypothetical protein